MKHRHWSDIAYIKENPATFLGADAAFVLECARASSARGNADEATRFSRMAILLYAVSLEAFINFVYKYHEVPETRWARLSSREKWLNASRECLACCGTLETEQGIVYRPGDPVETFDEMCEPFVSFLELKNFRDSLVHLDPPFVEIGKDEIESHLARENYYCASRLPKRLHHCGIEHAQTASAIYNAMVTELDRQMKGIVSGLFSEEGRVVIATITEVTKPGRD